MRTFFVSASIAVLCLPASAIAQDLSRPTEASDWFVRTRAIVGLSHAPGEFTTLPPGAAGGDQTSYQPQEYFGVGIGIGRGFTAGGVPLRAVLDGSLNFRHDTDVEALPGSTEYQANLQTWDLRLSLLADILRFGWGRFYAGGGIGAALVSTEVEIASTPVSEVNTEWKASPSFEAGIVFDGFSRRVIPEVSYRFRWIGDVESGAFSTGEKLRYKDFHIHDITFGFTIPLAPEPLAMSAVALFAPMPSMAPSEGLWTGFHVGGFGAWAHSENVDITGLATVPDGVPYNATNVYSVSDDGFLAGGQIGVDWQRRWLVLGLGGEAGFLGLDGSITDPASLGGDTVTSFETGWYGAVTARAGLALHRLLLFGRVGAIFLDAEARTIDSCTEAPCGDTTVDASEDDILFGFTAGAGVEYAFAEHWSVAAEYRYVAMFDELQPSDDAAAGGPYAQDVEIDRIHFMRGAVNYRW